MILNKSIKSQVFALAEKEMESESSCSIKDTDFKLISNLPDVVETIKQNIDHLSYYDYRCDQDVELTTENVQKLLEDHHTFTVTLTLNEERKNQDESFFPFLDVPKTIMYVVSTIKVY